MTIHTSKFTRNPRTLAVIRTNEVTNPTGWGGITDYIGQHSAGTTAVTVNTSAGAPASSRALRLTLPSAVTFWQINYRQGAAATPINANQVYTFSAYGRPSVAGTTFAQINWTSGGSFLAASNGASAAHAANAWERRSVTAAAPPGADGAYVTFRVSTAGATGNTLDVSMLLFEMSDTLGSYFDGSFTDSGIWYYRWTGATNASKSTANILNPLDVAVPALIDGYEAAADERTETHDVVNTESVIVSVQPATSKRGTFTLVFDDMYFAMIAFDLFCEGGLFDFTDDETPEVDMTIVPSGGRLDMSQDDTRGVWLIRLPFVEVV